jgi:hypothetical protein
MDRRGLITMEPLASITPLNHKHTLIIRKASENSLDS